MGWLNKLGKIALQAAPYVAAPFTGGASLMATGATQKLGQKWAEHDANEAAKKGLGPSKFDSMLGKASGIAGAVSSLTGGFGGKLSGGVGNRGTGDFAGEAGGKAMSGWQGKLAGGIGQANKALGTKSGGGWQDALGQVMASRNPSSGTSTGTAVPRAASGSGLQTVGDRFAQQTSGVMPEGGFDYNHNPMNQYNQNNPNLATSIFQGRMEGMGYPPPTSIMDNPDTLTPQIPQQNPRRRYPEYQ